MAEKYNGWTNYATMKNLFDMKWGLVVTDPKDREYGNLLFICRTRKEARKNRIGSERVVRIKILEV